MVVPRLTEAWTGISVNALGFAGSLFVRDQEQKTALKELGPMELLCRVAGRAEEA